MTDRRRLAAAVWLATVIAAASAPCLAGPDEDEARSRKLFKQGSELANSGQFAAACPLFQEAHDLHSTGGTALRAGDCYEKIGEYERALSLYEYILNHRDTDKEPERVALAERRATALRKQLAPPEAPTASATSAPAPTASATASPAVTSGPTALPGPAEKPKSLALPIGMLAGGGAGLAVGIGAGVVALIKADAVKAACDPAPAKCPEQKPQADEAKGLAWVSNFGFAVAVAGVVTGVVLFAVRSSPKAQQALQHVIGPGGVRFTF